MFSARLFSLTKCHGGSSECRSTLYQTAGDSFSLPLEKVEVYIKKGSVRVAWIGSMLRVGEAPHRNMDHNEGIYWSILTTKLQESPLVSLLESF